MKLAQVAGTVVSTINHPFFDGQRLLICGLEDGSGYLIAVDTVDASVGERVIVLDEGNGARQILDIATGPIGSIVVGIVDSVTGVDED